jgi:hypothetical protein
MRILHDYPAPCWSAKVRARAGGERTLAREIFGDTFTTAAEPEGVREIIVPVEVATGVNYQKMLQPASGFAIVGVAARLESRWKDQSGLRGVTGLARALSGRSVEPALKVQLVLTTTFARLS